MLASKSARTVLNAGVDYITATSTTAEGKRAFERMGYWELKKEEARGNEIKTYHAHAGQGIRCGAAEFLGTSDWYMLRFSSHLAEERWREVVKHSTNVSRLDLQATVRFDPADDNLAEKVERTMRRFKQAHNRKLMIELRRNDVKGKTLYTGSRQSELYARLYDKGRESRLEHYKAAWRLEVQHNDRAAKHTAAQLLTHDDITAPVLGHVATYYRARGAVVIDSTRVRLSRMIRPVDDRKTRSTISWLETQVRPTVLAEAGRGNLAEVLNALGLSRDMLAAHLLATEKE